MRAGPSGEERCTPHYTVPVSHQCPQEISLLTLPVFQGSAVSSERSLSLFRPEMLAELGGSATPFGVSRAARSGHPLPDLRSRAPSLAALSTPEDHLERLVPLVDYSAAWKLLAKCVSMGHAHCRNKAMWRSAAAFYGALPCWWVPSRLW